MFSKNDIQIKDNYEDNGVPALNSWSGSIYEYASKLVTATYLVTSLFPDSEPLKGHLRQKSLEMLSDVVSFFRTRSVGEVRVRSVVEEILSLIHTGFIARIVSPMNKNVLMDEYGRFLGRITKQNSHTSQSVASEIGDMFAGVSDAPKKEEILSYVIEDRGHSYKGQVRRTFSTKEPNKRQSKTDNNERKDKIISVIKQKGEVTIKDIASDIEGVSEKTVQRDLIDLLAKGVLKKKGERRWTTYSVV